MVVLVFKFHNATTVEAPLAVMLFVAVSSLFIGHETKILNNVTSTLFIFTVELT